MPGRGRRRRKPSRIHDGEALANADTPPQSFYELTANANLPLLTAIRIEVPPLDAEMARHTPEDGFIVDKVEAWVILPGGQKNRIAFRYFCPGFGEESASCGIRRDRSEAEAERGGSRPERIRGSSQTLPDTLDRGSSLRAAATGAAAAASRLISNRYRTLTISPLSFRGVRLAVSGDPRWTSLAQDPVRAQNLERLKQLNKQLAKIPSVPLPVMVEEEPYEQRATLEFDRGNFLTKIGPDLAPDVPGIFPKLPAGAPRNRLTLAKWFFAPGQPLTARVAVNRYWEELFGTGIVETLENFGSVGEEPSHPELLDWLALHFQNDLHWDMKALLREMVTSATYRQSAATTPALMAKDPRNRLLAHGPQQRLTAEMVRDQALLASGLLSTAMGGPPVMPPQPAGDLEFGL